MLITSQALEARARRSAQRVGLCACKSRKHVGSIDNYGDFKLIDISTNCPVGGFRYDMTAQEVIEYCVPHPR